MSKKTLEELSIKDLKLNKYCFDSIIDTFTAKLTNPEKIFNIKNQGIKRFAIYNYSKLFLNPTGTYNDRKTIYGTNLQTRQHYFDLLIGYTRFRSKSGVIDYLYNILINGFNKVRLLDKSVDSAYKNVQYIIDIQTEYDSYCIQNNLINFSSKRSSVRSPRVVGGTKKTLK